jgi:hypothetical protein
MYANTSRLNSSVRLVAIFLGAPKLVTMDSPSINDPR